MQILTLSYLLREGAICLGYKTRGIGDGYWNGFGGKLEGNETIEEGAVREIEEETTVRVRVDDLEKVAINEFFFKDGMHLLVHVFFVENWEGDITATEEMQKPTWYAHHEIPYEAIWEDDPHWLPRALKGEKLRGKVWFKDDGKTIEKMEWEAVTRF